MTRLAGSSGVGVFQIEEGPERRMWLWNTPSPCGHRVGSGETDAGERFLVEGSTRGCFKFYNSPPKTAFGDAPFP